MNNFIQKHLFLLVKRTESHDSCWSFGRRRRETTSEKSAHSQKPAPGNLDDVIPQDLSTSNAQNWLKDDFMKTKVGEKDLPKNLASSYFSSIWSTSEDEQKLDSTSDTGCFQAENSTSTHTKKASHRQNMKHGVLSRLQLRCQITEQVLSFR